MTSSSANLPPTANQEAKGWLAKNKVTLILVLVIALSNTGIYLFQKSRQSKAKTEYEETLRKQVEKVNELMVYRADQDAKTLGRAITFACGSELMTPDKQRLNLFFINMVQMTEADLISVVNPQGMIVLSTDKNYENQNVLDVLPTIPGRITAETVQQVEPDEFLYVAPITNGEQALGTLVLDYKTNSKTKKMVGEISALAPKAEAE